MENFVPELCMVRCECYVSPIGRPVDAEHLKSPDMSDAMEGVLQTTPAVDSSSNKDAKVSQESTPVPDVQALETLYIQNLNESIKIDVMKETLKALFANYGDVLNVTAHRNLRMRGQAFVSFESKDIARKAQREVDRFPLYGKPMVGCALLHYSIYNRRRKYLSPKPHPT